MAALAPRKSPQSESRSPLGSESPGLKMNRFSPSVSKPEDLNCCFWNILVLLAREPAFGFLREALSDRSGAPDDASSVDSVPGDFASFAEASEGGLEEAEDLPHAEETRSLPDAGEGSPEDEAPSGFPPHPAGQWSLQALCLLERTGHPLVWNAYNWGLTLFIAYRATVEFPSVWPIPGPQFRGFLLSLDSEGVSAAKIVTYLSGLSYLSHTFHFQDPLHDLFTSHMIACMRWQREPPIPLSVATLESLLGALERVCDCFYECLMFRAAFLLSFHAALRPKEIVAKSCTTFYPELLCMDNIEIEDDRVGLNIAVPEMGAGRITFWLESMEETWLCPVLALKNYLAVRPRGEGPLFLYSNWKLLCKHRFLDVFHSALRSLDLPAQRYRIHSFWLGALTTAVQCRFPETVILHLARWPCRPPPGRPRS